MNNVNIFELLSNVNEQLEKITLSEFLSVMSMVGKKIKSERKTVKEKGTISTRETEKMILLYDNIKNYLFDIFLSNEEKLSSVSKLLLLEEKIKKYISKNENTIKEISSIEMEKIKSQCSIIELNDIDEKIKKIKENTKTITIDEFDSIYECIDSTLKLLYESVNKIKKKSNPLDPSLIKKNEEIIVDKIKQIKKDYQIFNKKREIVESEITIATNPDDKIELVEKINSVVKITKIYDKSIEDKKKVNLIMCDLTSEIKRSLDYIDEKSDSKFDKDKIFIKDTKEKMSKYIEEANDYYLKIDNYKNLITKYKNDSYDNLAGVGIIKYEDYNDYKKIAGSDENKKPAPLNDDLIHLIFDNNIRLLGETNLEELYNIIDKVKNYLFAHQHFIKKGLSLEWNFTKNDLDKYILNPKKDIYNSTWPTTDTDVPPLPNPVQIIALYLQVLIKISECIFEEIGEKLNNDDNIRVKLKKVFVENNDYKKTKINNYKYNGKDYKDAIKKDSGCYFYIGYDNSQTKPKSQYILMSG